VGETWKEEQLDFVRSQCDLL